MRGLTLKMVAAMAAGLSLGFDAPAFALAGPFLKVAAVLQPVSSNLATHIATSTALEFRGARLGMTIGEWKSLPFPGKSADPVFYTCDSAPAGDTRARLQGVSSKPAARIETCAYASRDETGKSFILTKAYLVRQPRYTFVDDRLSKIEFQTSINAFNDVTALLDGTYGPPDQTLRDDVKVGDGFVMPRVQMIWRRANGSIRLIDPSSMGTQLVVRFTAQ